MGILSLLRGIRSPLQRMTYEEAGKSITEKAHTWKPDSRAEVHWASYAKMKHAPGSLVPQLVDLFAREGVAKGRALDLGCGSGAHTLDLLPRGWDVIAVDSNQTALSLLEKRAHDLRRVCHQSGRSMDAGKLTPVLTPMEDTIFPSDVDLVIAMHSLAYCNPAKVLTVWNRAQEALRPGGRIVASFARAPLLPLPTLAVRAWHTEPAVVDALMRGKGYQVELFSDAGRMVLSTGSLIVIGQKV